MFPKVTALPWRLPLEFLEIQGPLPEGEPLRNIAPLSEDSGRVPSEEAMPSALPNCS